MPLRLGRLIERMLCEVASIEAKPLAVIRKPQSRQLAIDALGESWAIPGKRPCVTGPPQRSKRRAFPELRPNTRHPSAKNPPPRQNQLQIITRRWRTIELETKRNQKGRRLEDASSRHVSKKYVRTHQGN